MSAGTNDVITIPGFFVGFSTGEIMKAAEGGTLDVEGVFANPPLPSYRAMHNVVVDGATTAYISWYVEGLRVVDFAGDTPTEAAHFVDTDDGSNYWGIYLYVYSVGNTYILDSDRNTGLWIFAAL